MTLSKFGRRPRVQPLPPVCRKPPIPQPPNAPLENLQGEVAFEVTRNGRPYAAFTATLHLQANTIPNPTRWQGITPSPDPRLSTTIETTPTANLYAITLTAYWPDATTSTVNGQVAINPNAPFDTNWYLFQRQELITPGGYACPYLETTTARCRFFL